MDELRGPNIQIVLHVKEGIGFGFVKSPFIVTGSLNGYILETDPTVPCHGPIFDAELVWEADKRRYRNLRVQNVPVKVEVHTLGTQGKKDKVGYMLLSLLGAQPCPANKVVDVKFTWHRLLGVKSEGRCCHPQLMLSLTVEDRISIPTPRNELRMFHCNEVAFISNYSGAKPATSGSMMATVGEYIAASKKTVTTPGLQPKLLPNEGLIQIGDGLHCFILSFVIGASENLHLLLPQTDSSVRICCDCFVKYSVFSHDIQTDRVPAIDMGGSTYTAHFNQRTSLRLRTELATLSKYFSECPQVVIRLCSDDKDFGICSVDLRKLFPTENLEEFLRNFCNDTMGLTIHERCFILPYEEKQRRADSRRAFLDVEYSLKYVPPSRGVAGANSMIGAARSVTQLQTASRMYEDKSITLEYKSGSCIDIDPEVGGVAYTNKPDSARNLSSGDAPFHSGEITKIIKKMCDSIAESQERLLSSRLRVTTSDMQVQCGPPTIDKQVGNEKSERDGKESEKNIQCECRETQCDDMTSKPILPQCEKELVKLALDTAEREAIMRRVVDELEDWKEKQQLLFTAQLKRKEEYHLDLLAKEWAKKRVELESKLSKGIEQCRTLANQLSIATEDLRMRPYRNSQREKKLLEGKTLLEQHYTSKLQELREASVRMEEDTRRQVREKDMKIEDLQHHVVLLEKQVDSLKKQLKNIEQEAQNKYSGLSKDQTAGLIQELRCLEEKLDSAVQSKAFFKEQWGRAVRELHAAKMASRRQMLTQLHKDRTSLHNLGVENFLDLNEKVFEPDKKDMDKLKDGFYADLLANTSGPDLGLDSVMSASTLPGCFDMFSDVTNVPKNPMNERLTELIARRDGLMTKDNPDEEAIKLLNQEIRNLLLNCGT